MTLSDRRFCWVFRVPASGIELAKRCGMAFRVETTTGVREVLIACQGHVDDEAMAAIDRAWATAEAAGLRPVIRLCAGATADRPVMVRLAAYAREQLQAGSPFLRCWIEELRGGRVEPNSGKPGTGNRE